MSSHDIAHCSGGAFEECASCRRKILPPEGYQVWWMEVPEWNKDGCEYFLEIGGKNRD